MRDDAVARDMDKKMIELDMANAARDQQKQKDREDQARKDRADMLEQEMQLKKLANYKKSDFAKAEIEREK